MKTSTRIALMAVVLLVAGVITTPLWMPGGGEGGHSDSQRYLTQVVDTGSIERIINATGTLNPVFRVTVGSQASGTVSKVHVDFNDAVRKGQLLAEIDPQSAQAQLDQAQAQIEGAVATYQRSKAAATRSRYLVEKGYITQQEADDALESERTAWAALKQQQALWRKEKSNLDNTRILSPVDGVVVTRDVNVGQTVAASFQTPSLFTLAQNLVEMQIDTNVSEADVGLVQPGQVVRFTVDAFPGEAFSGVVHQIRNNYTVVQNVVTYNVVVRTSNADGKLRPGMTTYVSIAVQKAADAVRIPNAALRYRPSIPVEGDESTGAASVWRLRDGLLTEVRFQPGVTNAVHTEAISSDLRPGDQVVVGERSSEQPAAPPGLKMF